MKKLIIISALLLSAASGAGAQTVRFMTQWTAQAQFAGYYMAQEKGFYAEEGLDVEINHVNKYTTHNSLYYLENGYVDIISTQLISAMIDASTGKDLVNILQCSQNSSLICISKEPFNSFSDLDGKTVGKWKAGFAEVADFYCHDHNVNIDWVNSLSATKVFNAGALDACLCYSYSEYLDILFSKGHIPDNKKFYFAEAGYNYPEDGLFTTSKYFQAHPDIVSMFVMATKRGWEYARQHPEETLEVVMRVVKENEVVTNRTVQKKMLEEILNLMVNPRTQKADFAPVDEAKFNEISQKLVDCGHCKTIVDYNTMIR